MQESDSLQQSSSQKNIFGVTAQGDTIYQYSLKNEGGVEMNIITYGGIIQSLKAPDKNGKLEEIVIGFDKIEDYEADNPFFGAIIGRYGNRIAKGKFTLNGEEYSLPVNDGPNHLHGGPEGFHRVVWSGEPFEDASGKGVKLSYLSKDGEQGYPGNLQTTVTYLLTPENNLEVTYEAETDKETIVNLTNHSYFNLSGDLNSTVLDQKLMIDADAFIPVDETLIPTGEIRKVEGTPFDFTEMKTVGKEIDAENRQLELGKGYDHCWVLNNQDGDMALAAKVYDEASGRMMEVHTTEPGIQFYSGNFLDGTLTGKTGKAINHRTALCLETQHYPNSPNQSEFPSVVLSPGKNYSTKTIFKFSTK